MMKRLKAITLLIGLLANLQKEPIKEIDYNYLVTSVKEYSIESSTKIETIQEEETLIDIEKIISIESSGNPNARNKYTNARGLMQVTPLVLEEWNGLNPKQRHTLDELFIPEINKKIGTGYLKDRIINHYLPFYNIEVTIENILIAYDWGIGSLSKMKEIKFDLLPEETQKYIKLYRGE